MVPNQAGVLWIALAVMIDRRVRLRAAENARNFELIALLAIGFLLFNVMRFFDLLGDPTYFWVMDLVFTGIVAVSLSLIALAIWRVRHPHPSPWQPNLPARPLMTLAILLLSMNVVTGLASPPDDAGFYTNLGAQRLRERGKFPYGDPLLTNSAGAGYGPLLYLAHLPFQFMLDPTPLNNTEPTRADLGGRRALCAAAAAGDEADHDHVSPDRRSRRSSRSACSSRNPSVAWALAALYCGSAYVMGVGGPRETIGGMTFISHIAPPAASMVAFAFLARPVAAGALLVMASATVFFPALFFPAWLGYYWDRRPSAFEFVGGCTLAAVLLGVPVVALSTALEGHSVARHGDPRIRRPSPGHRHLRTQHVWILGTARRHSRLVPRAVRRGPVHDQPDVPDHDRLRRRDVLRRAAHDAGAAGADHRHDRHHRAVVEDSRHRRLRELVLPVPADWIAVQRARVRQDFGRRATPKI